MSEELPGQLAIFDDVGRVIPARTTDPDTSHAATEEIKVKAGSQRARLLRSFGREDFHGRSEGLTDEEAMEYANLNPRSCWWKRCSELRDGGFIEPTGETRPGSAGPQRMLSRITDKGRAWLRENR